jgi:hypothetical protein
LTAARWGAGFAAVGRFVAEIEAAAANNGPLRPGYVLAAPPSSRPLCRPICEISAFPTST